MAELSPILDALYRGDRDEAERLRAERTELDVFEAAALGDVERLRAILEEDSDAARAWSPDGFTALHYAAYFDGPETARPLIEHGADVEAVSTNEEFAPQARPLHSAVAAGRGDVVEVLLHAGADPNARQHGGFTPLMAAEQTGNLELAEVLIRHGAAAGGGA
jgi:ankyrin repeat protein